MELVLKRASFSKMVCIYKAVHVPWGILSKTEAAMKMLKAPSS